MPDALAMTQPQDAATERSAGTRAELLHGFFERAARRWPQRVAVETPPSRTQPLRRAVTYRELDARSDALAAFLREFVTGECVVAVLLPRDSEQIYLAQLGVLKAGAAHVCPDPSSPDAQVSAILEDSRPACVLTDAAGAARLRAIRVGRPGPPVIDLAGCNLDGHVNLPPAPWLTGRSLAYLIYTSGTTGKPKGVMIEHAAISNLIAGERAAWPVTPEDRVGQSSSCAYDSSVDEVWLALAAGATLVVMDDDTTRLGPDLVPWLRRERVTIFCPPPTLLRSAGQADPARELPDLRRIHVGGEPLTDDVASRWGPGRVLVNDYGPTECSVVALRGVIRPGGPIHIGRPVPGIGAWVVDETLNEVPAGQTGELCLGGVGLARGYLNDPELTARKFVDHPRLGRIYRTGDLAHRDGEGLFYCHGRIDTQVKVRGYRIELEAVEARLAECPGVREAVCRVQGEGAAREIAAFIVPDNPARPPAFDALKAALRAVMPEYGVPARFGVLERLPRTVGGKLDRRALPTLEGAARAGEAVAARTEAERKVAEAFGRALGVVTVSVEHDFFHELGGDSLRAALAVSLLRDAPATAGLTVRDLYETRTAAGLAARVTAPASAPVEKTPRREGRPLLATAVQTAWLLAGLFVLGPVAYLLAFHVAPDAMQGMGLTGFLLVTPLLVAGGAVLYGVGAVCFAVALKWLLIGRYTPCREPVWGGLYVRNWMVSMAVKMIPWRVIDETVLQNAVLRLLGARIGRRVHIHRGVNLLNGGWDLLEIGDDATLGREAAVRVIDYDDGQVVAAPVRIGAGCTLDVRAGLAGGAGMGDGSFLTAHSFVTAGVTVPAGECWSGVPAAPAGQAPGRADVPEGERELPPWLHGLAIIAGRGLLGLSAVLPLIVVALCASVWAGVDAADVAGWLLHPALEAGGVLLGAAVLVLSVPLSLVSRCLTMRALGRVPEGVVGRWGWTYVRVVLKADILDGANEWLSGTLMWPMWLRGAGMRVGARSELSTIFDTVPELTEIGADSFLADGIFLGGPRVHRGAVTLARTRLGDNVFLGNYAVVPAGVDMPDGVLLGVCTVADPARVRPGTSWFGHPPFELPRREVHQADVGVTYRPTRLRYCNRVFWEVLRFTLPLPPAALVLAWVALAGMAEGAVAPLLVIFGVVPALEVGFLVSLCVLGLGLKWALLGRVRPGTHALWSCWVSRWDFNYTAWHYWAHGPLSALEGTLWLSWYLRAMGVKVGERVVIADAFALVVDPDMIECEDGATVGALFQAHTFEDRVLKIGRVRIGKDATVGHAALLLYGADVGAGAAVVGNSVVMKHERLLPGRGYAGCPTREVG